ncbi:hypothetical protein DV917_08675, partial [Campylobacter coli]|nr:hypothetical protein [Campylobacter coli]
CDIVKYEALNKNKQKEKLEDFLKLQYNFFIQTLGYLSAQNDIINDALKKLNFDDLVLSFQ